MSKISIEDLKTALNASNVEPEKQQKVLEEIEQIIQENKNNNPPAPKQKNEFGVILYAPELMGKEYTASVYQIKNGDDHGTVLGRIFDAAKDHNESVRKKANLIKSVGDAFAHMKRKFIKAKGINLKTKEPVRVIITNNQIIW